MSIAGINELQISAKAVVGFAAHTMPCVFTLEPSAKDSLLLDSNSAIEAPDCTVQVNSSDPEALRGNSSGDIEANTSDGDIVMRLGAIEGVKVTTHDGDIVLYVPEGFAADVSLRARI